MRLPFKTYMTVVLLLFIIVSIMPGIGVTAESLESIKNKAQNYYYGHGVRKDLSKSFLLYLEAAERGDPDAMFIVGGLYTKGKGTPENKAEGFKWLYKAAAEGKSSKESERILGQFFLVGEGVPQNYAEAVHWYERAAKGGDSQAQSELGYLYFSGENVAKDYDKAYQWFKTAAENGYALAQYNMGVLWFSGNGVPEVDLIKAYGWFSLAAANGHKDGEVAKNFLTPLLSREDLKHAQEYSIVLFNNIESRAPSTQK